MRANPMARQPFFNQLPFALALLTGAIALAHIGRILAPIDAQNAIIETLAIFPLRWEAALDKGNLLALAPSMFGHVFVHAGWLHLFFNATLLVSVGRGLAQRLAQAPGGNARFFIIFFGSAAFAALTFVAIDRGSPDPAFGASGAVCGVYSAYLMSV